MMAIVGSDKAMWRNGVGVYCPASLMANDAGIEVLSKRNAIVAKRELAEAGYNGEPVVLLAPTDFPAIGTLADITADMLKKCGMNVDYRVMDWGTLTQRRTSIAPTNQGGWSCSIRPRTIRCAATAKMPGSAGQPVQNWKSDGMPGSMRLTQRISSNCVGNCSCRTGWTCRSSRSVNSFSRRRTLDRLLVC
jgi:hypothetical protein